ncbi:hypothetical protein MKW92_043166, partial [Papaver armeniacum]
MIQRKEDQGHHQETRWLYANMLVFPLPPSNTVSSASASMSQGGGRKRTVFYPYYIPPPAPHHFGEEIHTRS